MKLLPALTSVKTVYMLQIQISETEGYIHQLNDVTQFYSNVLKAEKEANRIASHNFGWEITVVKFEYTIN